MSDFSIKEIFKDALPIIQGVAPTLAHAIAGPAGFVVANIVPILAHAFKAEPNDINQLVNNIMNDPDAEQKLKALDSENSDWLNAFVTKWKMPSELELNIKAKWI